MLRVLPGTILAFVLFSAAFAQSQNPDQDVILEEAFVCGGALYLYGNHIERPESGYHLTRTNWSVSIGGDRVGS